LKLLTHYAQAQRKQTQSVVNWRENNINDALYYSYRSTHYDSDDYPSHLHYHDYYELLIFLEGDIEYVCDAQVFRPRCGDIVLIPPRTVHMSRILCDRTLYRRHVFYLYPEAFAPYDCEALAAILQKTDSGGLLTLSDSEQLTRLLSLLEDYDRLLASEPDPLTRALSTAQLLQIFYLLNGAALTQGDHQRTPTNVLEIRAYLDAHATEISSVSAVAEHFFYSREYLSRLFKKYYNTSVADYLRQRRIAHSQALIAAGSPITDACYLSGFGNMSAFIRAFRQVAGTTPSAYRKMLLPT